MSNNIKTLTQGTIAVLPEGALEKKLKKKKRLTIKLGMDPTAPDLHLGHAVVLRKLKQFQDQGHEIIFLIGDFTARIGDPSGKSKTRPPLTRQEIERNTQTYFQQVGRVLDTSKIQIRYNSEWLDELSIQDLIELCSKVTVARLIEREDFASRLSKKQPISFHELLYPLMQGYDSVALHADVELGGNDQTFNLLMGRALQEQYDQEPQVILTTPLIEGLDGVQKMSKSLDNYIALTEKPEQAYGKLMSVSDDLILRYAQVLLYWTDETLKKAQQEFKHPMDLKKAIAHKIIELFWSEKEADAGQQQFEDLIQKKDLSKATEVVLPGGTANPIWVVDFLKALGALKTSTEAKRLIESKSVVIDEATITDFKAEIDWKSGTTVKVGKHRIYKIK